MFSKTKNVKKIYASRYLKGGGSFDDYLIERVKMKQIALKNRDELNIDRNQKLFENIPEIENYNFIDFTNPRFPPKIKEESQKYPDIEFISINYKSDNFKVHGYILKNKNTKNKTPVVIYCRGGNNHPDISAGELKPGDFFYNEALIKLLNDGKIIVLATNYRGSKFSEGVDEFCGKDINDVINLYPIIQGYNIMDETKIALYGWSRGCTTALLVHKKVDWVKCLILGAGQYDYLADEQFRPRMYNMLKRDFKFELSDFQKRSAINWTDELPKKPILLLHGTSDGRVSVESSLKLAIELFKHQIPYKLVVYPGGSHGLIEYKSEFNREIVLHLEKYLLDEQVLDLTLHL